MLVVDGNVHATFIAWARLLLWKLVAPKLLICLSSTVDQEYVVTLLRAMQRSLCFPCVHKLRICFTLFLSFVRQRKWT